MEQLAQVIILPLLSGSQLAYRSGAMSIMLPRSRSRAALALSLVLQANSELGVFIVTHGAQKQATSGVKLAGQQQPVQQPVVGDELYFACARRWSRRRRCRF